MIGKSQIKNHCPTYFPRPWNLIFANGSLPRDSSCYFSCQLAVLTALIAKWTVCVSSEERGSQKSYLGSCSPGTGTQYCAIRNYHLSRRGQHWIFHYRRNKFGTWRHSVNFGSQTTVGPFWSLEMWRSFAFRMRATLIKIMTCKR